MIPDGYGHYVAITAEGPGPPLWYTEDGTWTTDSTQKKVFTGVPRAVHVPIVGLPQGYHARLVCVEIEVQPQPVPDPCQCPW